MGVSIEIARNAGACYGVNRALEMARGAADNPGPVHTLGPLIHNPRVVDDLAIQGVAVADTLDEAGGGTLVLRSHGTAPQIVDEATKRGFTVVDATCPYVSKVQRKARQLAEAGYAVVIIGELGGTMEEEVAEAMEAKAFTKPLVAFMGGRTAPEGKRMGHAGAIVTGGRGTVKGKTEAIVKAGGKVAKRPSEVGALLKALLG